MSAVWSSVAPIWKVLLVGLVLGAGLPALVALGMRSLAVGSDGPRGRTSPAGIAGAAVCFLVVAVAVIAGLVVLTASKTFLARWGLS
ncbi:hypothetical protein [Nakamurella endophytica]|uniref:Uncharacterized protein n=1 Tax=Nakamurella endophytica TaxID=1748367 RepID=A0A917WHT6_9ACTN|nr:hypothetical protein [Nakamurella endophytica]GGM07455.1 hypothetical protein GCM10011594_29270 [Nakamurella endophytica]